MVAPTLVRVRIDLHTHSTCSDGTEPPAEVVAQAARAGLDVVALTDHDTVDGWDEAAVAARSLGVGLVRGTEVSARSKGWVSVHLLSYLHDPSHAGLAAELAAARESRETRARRIVELLGADFPIAWQDVLDRTEPGTTIGRPHIADALVDRGVVTDRAAAFEHLLRPGSRYYAPHYAPEVTEAVALVRAAGGVPVFAHPGADGRGRVVADRVIAAMVDAGLAGLEVHHRDHSPAQVSRLLALAEQYGLFVTGSSDYHGEGKANRLGEHTTAPEVLDAIAAQGAIEVLW